MKPHHLAILIGSIIGLIALLITIEPLSIEGILWAKLSSVLPFSLVPALSASLLYVLVVFARPSGRLRSLYLFFSLRFFAVTAKPSYAAWIFSYFSSPMISTWLSPAPWYLFIATFAGTCVSSWLAGFLLHALIEKPLRMVVAVPRLVEAKPMQGLPTELGLPVTYAPQPQIYGAH